MIYGPYTVQRDEELAEGAAKAPTTTSPPQNNEDRRHRLWHPFHRFRQEARNDIVYFGDFIVPRWRSVQQDFTRILRWIMFPCLGVAALLFYVFENPPTGVNDDEGPNGDGGNSAQDGVGTIGSTHPASISWWLIFLGVRQCITLELGMWCES
jgi:hypothetical protein